jgi:hypothetical protein
MIKFPNPQVFGCASYYSIILIWSICFTELMCLIKQVKVRLLSILSDSLKKHWEVESISLMFYAIICAVHNVLDPFHID